MHDIKNLTSVNSSGEETGAGAQAEFEDDDFDGPRKEIGDDSGPRVETGEDSALKRRW